MLEGVAEFFSGPVFRTEAGVVIHGVPRQPRDVSDDFAGMRMPRRLLLVPKNSPATAGQILVADDGRRYMLASWPSDVFLGHVVARQFAMLECSGQYTWVRPGTTTDPVSGLRRPATDVSMGSVWGLLERARLDTDKTGFDSYQRRLISVAAIQPGDMIAGRKVAFVDTLRGLVIADLA